MSDVYQEPEDATQPTGLSNKGVVKGRNKKIDQKQVERREVLAKLMAFSGGRRWMYWLMEKCQRDVLPLQYPGPGQPVDTHATTFNIGKASIGNLLVAECLAASPDDYLKMIRESKEPTDG